MNDPDQTIVWSKETGNDLSQRLLNFDDEAVFEEEPTAESDEPVAEEDPAIEFSGTYTNLGFIGAALKRKLWLCCVIALAGLLIGSGAYLKFPPTYQASTTIILKNNPNDDPTSAMETDATLADSRTVASRVVQQLNLRQSVQSLIAASTVNVITDQLLTITVSAPSSNEAVRQTAALATTFLQFRAQYLQGQQQLLAAQVDRQVDQAQQRLNSVSNQITSISAQPTSAAQQAKLRNLQAQSDAQTAIVQNGGTTLATAQTLTTSLTDDSMVLDGAAPVLHSRFKTAALYILGGLIAGLAVGMAIVIVWALTSDRLRARSDVAEVISAPVRLSVGPLRLNRRRLGLGRRVMRARDVERVAAHLRSVMPQNSPGTVGLAVVAVDNARTVAPVIQSLAVSCARQGKKVVVADLAGGALAHRLGAKAPGVSTVSVAGQHLVAAIPDRGDFVPVGPLDLQAPGTPAREGLLAACASADLLLTFSTLDPASGGEHLATWATDVVAVVTAGRSSGARIHGVGEMVRLAGTGLVSVVLIGADKKDETLGVAHTPDSLRKPG